MMYRAQIAAVSDKYHYKVRIPQLNKTKTALGATPDSELYTATVSVQAGLSPAFRVGDAVFVEMETLSTGAPVILGLIYNDNSKKVDSGAFFSDIEIKTKAVFPTDTTIGEITSSNIGCLKGLYTNVQDKFSKLDKNDATQAQQITVLSTRSQELEDKVDGHAERLKDAEDKIDDLADGYQHLSDDIDDHISDSNGHVSPADRTRWNNTATKEHKHTGYDIVPKDGEPGIQFLHPIVLTEASYGKTLPDASVTPLVEGQLFFLEYTPDNAVEV